MQITRVEKCCQDTLCVCVSVCVLFQDIVIQGQLNFITREGKNLDSGKRRKAIADSGGTNITKDVGAKTKGGFRKYSLVMRYGRKSG